MDSNKSLINEIVNLMPEFYKFFIKPFEMIARENVTGTQLFVLTALQESGRSAMSDIAGKLWVSKQQLTVLIDGLEKSKYVVRIHNEKDRRKVEVEITEQGAAFMRGIRERMCEVYMGRFSILDEADKLELSHSVRTVREMITKIDSLD